MAQMLVDLVVVVDIITILEHREINIHQVHHYSQHPYQDKEILVVIMDLIMLAAVEVVQVVPVRMVVHQEQVQIQLVQVV